MPAARAVITVATERSAARASSTRRHRFMTIIRFRPADRAASRCAVSPAVSAVLQASAMHRADRSAATVPGDPQSGAFWRRRAWAGSGPAPTARQARPDLQVPAASRRVCSSVSSISRRAALGGAIGNGGTGGGGGGGGGGGTSNCVSSGSVGRRRVAARAAAAAHRVAGGTGGGGSFGVIVADSTVAINASRTVLAGNGGPGGAGGAGGSGGGGGEPGTRRTVRWRWRAR